MKDSGHLLQQMSVKDQRSEELIQELQEKTNEIDRLIYDVEGMVNEWKCFTFRAVLNRFNTFTQMASWHVCHSCYTYLCRQVALTRNHLNVPRLVLNYMNFCCFQILIIVCLCLNSSASKRKETSSGHCGR